MEKITKENLIERIAVLKDKNERLILQDQTKRKEFAQVFGWQTYGYSTSLIKELDASWERIFVEVGKLLATKNFYDFEGNVSELKNKLEDLEKRLLKNVNPI